MSRTLLNECRACNMKFENSEQLNNHTKKFCQGSDYGDIQKLEEKIYNKELRDHRLAKGTISEENMQAINDRKKRDLSKVGQMSLQDIKEKAQAEDREYQRVKAMEIKDRDAQIQKELNKLQEERSKVKLQCKEDEELLEDLMREMEAKKEKELRNRIEKDQIRRALVDLEKAKIMTLGQEKKRELEEIEAERQQIKLKEQELMQELEDLETNQKMLDDMRQEEVQRMEKEVNKLSLEKKENKNVDTAMVQERAEKVTSLKMRREQLESEKGRIEQNLGHIKNGDFHLVQKEQGSNLATIGARNMILDREDLEHYNLPGIREKLQANENRIKQLRNDKLDPVYASDELLYKDGNRGLTDNVAAYYDDLKNQLPSKEGLDSLRQNLEIMQLKHQQYQQTIDQAAGTQNPDQAKQYADNMLNDLNRLKKSYVNQGGNDPKFVENMNDLERFYQNQQQSSRVHNRSRLNLSNLPPGLDENQPQQATINVNTYDNKNNQIQHTQQYNPLTNDQQQPQSININIPPTDIYGNKQPIQQTLPYQQHYQSQPNLQLQQQQNPYFQPSNIPNYNPTQSFPQQQQQLNNVNPNVIQALQNNDNKYMNQIPGESFTLNEMMGAQRNGGNLETFAGDKEGFMQNEVRNPDLNDEERAVMNFQAQEVDALRVLSTIPIGTELYRFKMEQYKELSTIRSEMEKIVQEQRLQRLKKDYDRQKIEQDRKYEQQQWVDEQYKLQIQSKMSGIVPQSNINNTYNPQGQYRSTIPQNSQQPQQSMGLNRQGQNYNEMQGFSVHFDYVLGLPPRSSYAQIVLGIYQNGETVYSPKMTDPKDCELQDNKNSRCIFSDSHLFVDIPANKYNLLIMEIQLPYSKNIEENLGRTESFGWCIINLFDSNRELNRGKWKCPVYLCPCDPQIQPQNIKDLKIIHNAWLFLRISHTNDPQYGSQRALYPEQTMNEYNVPSINQDKLGYNELNDSKYKQNKLQDNSYEPSMLDNSRMRRQNNSQQALSRASQSQYSDILPQSAGSDRNIQRGLEVTIEFLNNYLSRSHLKIMIAIMEGKTAMVDDNQLSCVFNSSIHNPKSPHVNPITNVIELRHQNPQMQHTSNKQEGQKINFFEKYKFFKDLRKHYRKNQKELFLGIQVVENRFKSNQDTSRNNDISEYEEIDFQLIGWNFISLTKYDGNIQTGRLQSIELFKPQMRTPPVNKAKVQKTDFSINLNLELFEYDDKQLQTVQNERLNQTIPE